jgi:IucA / IucC family
MPGSYDLYSPRLRLAAFPRASLNVTGDFEASTRPILDATIRNAGKALDVPQDHVIVPVHELQVPHILEKFKEATIYPEEFSVPARAQQSVRYLSTFCGVEIDRFLVLPFRSVILPGILLETHLKLGVGIKLTSAVRTISPASAYLGPRFSAQVVPALHFDRSLLTVARELASVSHVAPDSEIAKHCGAIVRECHENGSEARGERLIVCTSLVERGHVGTDGVTPSIVRAFELDTEDKRIRWLDE